MMNQKTSTNIGNAHLETLMGYTKTMVAANRVRPEEAPAFMNELSEAMLDTLAKFEKVANVAAAAARDASNTGVNHGEREEARAAKTPKFSKTAKMREAFTQKGSKLTEAGLPAVAAAHRFQAPKRGVGRPRKDAQPAVVSKEQRAFDRAFLSKYPILPGLDVANSVGPNEIIVLFDGKKLKMIKRYLESSYGINFEDYKRIYSLPADYPSCAPGYKVERSRHARSQGLGTVKVPKTPKGSDVAPISDTVDVDAAVPDLAEATKAA